MALQKPGYTNNVVGTQFVASAWGGTPNEDAIRCVPTTLPIISANSIRAQREEDCMIAPLRFACYNADVERLGQHQGY